MANVATVRSSQDAACEGDRRRRHRPVRPVPPGESDRVGGRAHRPAHVNTVGAYVSKGKPVAEVYSPDLVAAQQEYLLA